MAPPLRSGGATSAIQTSDKENRPPGRSHGATSVSTIFEQAKKLKRGLDVDSALNEPSTRSTKVAKSIIANAEFFAQFSKPRKEDHPVFRAFAETTKDYRTAAKADREEQLESAYAAMMARLDGLDNEGKPVERSGIPTKADWACLYQTEELLDALLEDRLMTIRLPLSDGTSKIKQIRLGDTLEMFRHRHTHQSAKIHEWNEQVGKVDTEIRELREQLVADHDEIQLANGEHDAEMVALKEELGRILEQTLAAIVDAEKKEKQATKEFNKRVKDFFETMA